MQRKTTNDPMKLGIEWLVRVGLVSSSGMSIDLDRLSVKLRPEDVLEDCSGIGSSGQSELQLNPTLLVVDESGTDRTRVRRSLGGCNHTDVDSNVSDDGDTARDDVADGLIYTKTSVGTCGGNMFSFDVGCTCALTLSLLARTIPLTSPNLTIESKIRGSVSWCLLMKGERSNSAMRLRM